MLAPPQPPSAAAAAAGPSTGCTPGSDGIPEGALGRLLCGDYPLVGWWHTLAASWPLLTAAVVGLVAARLAWVWLRHRRWRSHAARARWLEITPPVTATPAATAQLWRLLATLLPAPRWWQTTPGRLVWEVAADPDTMRCGLWVPPGINPSAVIRVVQRAWPGARLDHTGPPTLPRARPVAAHRLQPTVPEWLPLTDDPSPATSRRETTPPEQDRLRAVFDGLAAAGRTGGGLLQVHISRAPRGRVAALRRATVDPRRARRRGGDRAAGVLLAAVTGVVRGLLDLLSPGTTPRRREAARRQVDPYTAQLTSQARIKYGNPPHLLTAVYAAGTGPTKAAAGAAAADINSGYALVSAHLARRRLRRPHTVLHQRRAATAAMTLVSVAEVAALAGLPAEPAAYGLPQAASRRRGAARDTWTAPEHPTPPAHTEADSERHAAGAATDDESPEPAPWSVP
jgi:hypothetical protein